MRSLTRIGSLLLVALLAACVFARASLANPQLIGSMCVCAPPGWSADLVPRMTPDATADGGFYAPDSLLSTQPTWFNFSTHKNAAICGTWTDALYLDGVAIDLPVNTDCEWAAKYFVELNRAPTIVRGGRHEIVAMADIAWNVAVDYAFRPTPVAQQWTWSPAPLPARAGLLSATPAPDPGGYMGASSGIADGYQLDRASGAAWIVSAYANDPAADVNLGLYVDPWHGSTTGFSVERARSRQLAGGMDFVVGGEGAPGTVYPAVMRGATAITSGYSLWASDAANRRDSTGTARWSETLPAGQPAALYEVWLPAGKVLHAALTRTTGAEDLALSVFPPTVDGTWSRQDALALAGPAGAGDADTLSFVASQAGWHPVVVFRSHAPAPDSPSSYVLQFGSLVPAATDPGEARFFVSAPATTKGEARITFGLSEACAARLEILDLQGRRVKTLAAGAFPAGPQAATWCLQNERGERVGAGIYWARLVVAGARRTARVIVLR